MSKIKLKNQDAKELFDEFERFEMFVHTRWKWMVTGGIAIVVAVAVYGGVAFWLSYTDNKAVSALGVLERKPSEKAKEQAELEAALAKYPNHAAALRARQRLIKIYTDEKKYDEAIAQYALILKGNIEQDIRWRSELDLAYLYELKGENEKAATEFDRIGSTAASDDVRSEANYAAGRLYLQQDKHFEADKCLRRVLASPMTMTNNFWQMQARYLAAKVVLPTAAAAATAE